jgi:hypothetical protein
MILGRAGMIRGLAGATLASVVVLTGGILQLAEAATGSGFTFSPAFTQIALGLNQPQAKFVVILRNQATTSETFRLSVVDFGSLNEEGGVAFLGAASSDLEHKYGLSSWMKADKDSVTVPGGGTVNIGMTIDNRTSLSPGGHYGALLATVADGSSAGSSAPQVGLKQVLSSLVLAIKDGGLVHNLSVVSQTANGGWWQLPTMSEQRFHNTGNVQDAPRGIVEVKDPRGRVVVRGALNEGSTVVLPDTFRRYRTDLISIAKAWLPGRYQVVTTYRYDGEDQTKTIVTWFWYTGQLIVLFGVLLIACVVAFFGWRIWRKSRR